VVDALVLDQLLLAFVNDLTDLELIDQVFELHLALEDRNHLREGHALLRLLVMDQLRRHAAF